MELEGEIVVRSFVRVLVKEIQYALTQSTWYPSFAFDIIFAFHNMGIVHQLILVFL